MDNVTRDPVSVLIDHRGLALSNLLRAVLTATLTLMPPLSLLFSSDQETSRVLIQTLRELEFEVEHCPEIFAAVQRLTSRKLDVIVADWDDGLEASFLLKTSRELKRNNAVFTVAVVSGREAEIAARHLDVDCVLTKPFSIEQSKYTLLTCDVFLTRMRQWLPKIVTEEQSRLQNPFPISSSRAQGAYPTNLTDQAHRPVRSEANGRGSVPSRYSEKSKKARQTRANSFLIAAIATTCLSCAYAMHDRQDLTLLAVSATAPLRSVVTAVTAWGRPTGINTSQKSVAVMPSQDLLARDGVTRIRVGPAHHASIQNSQRHNNEEEVAAPPALNPELIPTIPVPQIPESLRSEALSSASSGPVSAALLGALEPVNITEDLSENLLLEKVLPRYPEQAVRSGLQGSVVLQALIGRDGRIQSLKLVQGSFLLGQSAFEAVKQWRYRPYFLNGRPVQAQTLVTVDFSLPRSAATLPSAR